MEVRINGELREYAKRMTLADLLRELKMPALHVAIEVNERLIPRDQHGSHQVEEGDAIEIVTLVGGG